jgi:uncharacterized protein YgiM (DUF1202 family)
MNKLKFLLLTTTMAMALTPTTVFANPDSEDSININSDELIFPNDIFSSGALGAINNTIILNDFIKFSKIENLNLPIVAIPNEQLSVETLIDEDFSIPIIDEIEQPKFAVAANIEEYLSIRTEPNINAEVLGKLHVGGVANILEILDGWIKIESGNVIGYAKAEYLSLGGEDLYNSRAKRIATVNTEALRVRQEATTKSRTLDIVSEGDRIIVLDEGIKGWIKIKQDSLEGYVKVDYVSIETVFKYAESIEEEQTRLEEERKIEEAKKKKAEQRKKSNKSYKAPSGSNGQSVVNYAVQFVGNPYVWGGESLRNGADCSGFVKSIYAAFGVSLPHSSSDLRSVGYGVRASEVQPGDIICYSGHVAIYMGDGKIVHASNKKDGIKISYNWQYKQVLAIRRIF